MEQVDKIKIIGISVETINESGKSAQDLGKLWERFYSEDISGNIPNKTDEEVYSIYTGYESDYTGVYTSVIGLKVSSLDIVPEGFIGIEIGGGTYRKFVAKGEMPDAVIATWQEIWEQDASLNRAYTSDFEVYGPKSQNGAQSEVEIFIAIK